MNLRILLFLSVAFLLSSCSSTKSNVAYFENIDTVTEEINIPKDYEVKIIPDDELLINVSSLMPKATMAYNIPLANTGSREDSREVSGQPVLQSYVVDKNGCIMMPVIGKLNVSGLTTKQVSEMIAREVGKSVKDPYVRVQLLNFRVNVLGEVNKPGAKTVLKERYTVLDAIADAEDLTIYGRRDNVLLIREENGKIMYHRLNLNDANVLTSPYYYLRQNDVVFVEPNKVKEDSSKYNHNNGYKLSVISTVVSAASVIASLVIALVVK